MNDKGIMNMIVMVIFFFVIAVVLVAIHSVNRTIDTVENELGLTGEAEAVAGDIKQSSINFIDGIALFFVIGFALVAIISSFFVSSNPFFFVISILLLFVMVFGSAMLSNQYDDFVSDPEYALVEADLTFLPHIMANWPLYMLGVGIITLIGFSNFLRSRGEDI